MHSKSKARQNSLKQLRPFYVQNYDSGKTRMVKKKHLPKTGWRQIWTGAPEENFGHKAIPVTLLSTGFMSGWCIKSIQKFTVLSERPSTVENLIYRPSKEGFFISLLVNNKSVICYGSIYYRMFSLPNAVYV